MLHPSEPTANDLNQTTFEHDPETHLIHVKKENKWRFPVGSTLSKFILLSAIQFKYNHSEALSYIQYQLMGEPVTYVRIGVDYFNVITKPTRYGGTHEQLKRWNKDTINDDHGKGFLQLVPKYSDFIMEPDNKNYQRTMNNCYNMYSRFEHTPHSEPVTPEEIPTTLNFLRHIFQDHFEMGLTYFKVLYEYPKQILPILVLLSETNETGKTTLLNLMEMIFGDNYTLISPEMLTKEFNVSYATKNIIAMEEAFVEKQMGVEKLKSLSTGKSISVSRKFIDDYPLPFYGKIVMCSNKVKDFMRISSTEIRFWIREVPPIPGKKNRNIEREMFEEIPKFLRYLTDMPALVVDRESRMVFSAAQLDNMALRAVKEESMSGLFKEISELVNEFFENNPSMNRFYASLKDIKDMWFAHNNQISMAYIKKVLQDEAKMKPTYSHSGKSVKYYKFGDRLNEKVGTPYLFTRQIQVDMSEIGTTE